MLRLEADGDDDKSTIAHPVHPLLDGSERIDANCCSEAGGVGTGGQAGPIIINVNDGRRLIDVADGDGQ